MTSFRADILAAFREKGIRCTSQRYGVLEYVMKSRSHPTAEQIFQAVNRSDPRASLATIYKNLHVLERAGLIREMVLESQAVRFEANTKRHHHFVCERCGRVEDIEWFDVPHLSIRAALGPRTVRSYELVLRGLCNVCR